MPKASFNTLANANPQTAIAVLASGQNPDGTPFKLEYETTPTPPRAFALLGTNNSAMAISSSVTIVDWTELSAREWLIIARRAADGMYVFEIDWSRDGSTVDVVETVTVPDNGFVRKDIAMPYARMRVRNTSAVAAFSSHRTTVYAR